MGTRARASLLNLAEKSGADMRLSVGRESQWRKSGSKSGVHHREARRAELRVQASRPVGLRVGEVLGEGMCPSPPARYYVGAL